MVGSLIHTKNLDTIDAQTPVLQVPQLLVHRCGGGNDSELILDVASLNSKDQSMISL
jgi:hypothetical protein